MGHQNKKKYQIVGNQEEESSPLLLSNLLRFGQSQVQGGDDTSGDSRRRVQMEEGTDVTVQRDGEANVESGGREALGEEGRSEYAERIRLAGSNLYIDLQQLAQSLDTTLPFLAILICSFIVKNLSQVLCLMLGTFALFRSNATLQEASLQNEDQDSLGKRQIALLGGLLLAQAIFYTIYIPNGLIMLDTVLSMGYMNGITFGSTLLAVCLSDTTLRLFGAAYKSYILYSATIDSHITYKKRGCKFAVIDTGMMICRVIFPVGLWSSYLIVSSGLPFILAIVGSGTYFLLKVKEVLRHLAQFLLVFDAYRKNKLSVGKSLGPEERTASSCAICHEECKDPVQLECKHTFCEECINEWVEREPTCPICRARVLNVFKGLRIDATTSIFPILC
eukprot:jgi/Picsp_1/122/NSC_00122-R1_protein